MLTLFFKDGTRQVIRPTKEFYKNNLPSDVSIPKKCADIAHDFGAFAHTFENMK